MRSNGIFMVIKVSLYFFLLYTVVNKNAVNINLDRNDEHLKRNHNNIV
jgi:hypothetical protein